MCTFSVLYVCSGLSRGTNTPLKMYLSRLFWGADISGSKPSQNGTHDVIPFPAPRTLHTPHHVTLTSAPRIAGYWNHSLVGICRPHRDDDHKLCAESLTRSRCLRIACTWSLHRIGGFTWSVHPSWTRHTPLPTTLHHGLAAEDELLANG